MIVFWSVLKNDLHRMLEHKSRIFLILFLTAGAVAAAIFFNTKADVAGHIALVTQHNQEVPSSPYLNITQLDKEPPLSELVSNKYDAVVVDLGNGAYDIQTIKSDDFKENISLILSDPAAYHADAGGQRKIGTSIVGFLIMFILMQGFTLMFLFAEDKEKMQIRRIASSPVSFTGYLCAHSLFSFLFILIPTMAVLYFVKFLLQVDIGFGFWQYLLLISVLSAFSTALALLLNAVIQKSDSANMMGSAISVLTSVLAGSFYSFDKGNQILETIIKGLPQKSYLTLANGMETGAALPAVLPHFLYIAGLTLVFFLIAVIKTRKDYIRSN